MFVTGISLNYIYLNIQNILHTEYNFKSSFFKIGDNKLHYIDEGVGDVIIMVHGNPTWSFFYRKLITLLSKKFRVIAIDHMGCGLSDKPQTYSYTLQNHIDNLSSLVQNLKIEKYSLVVHDWGGAIGMGLAEIAPEKVEKIVVMNTAAFRSIRIPFRISICRIPLLGKILVRGFNGFAWPATFMAVSKLLDESVASTYLRPYNSWNNRVAVHAFVKDIPLDSSHPSYRTLERVERGLEKIKDLQIPFLIIWGGKDFCFNDSFYKEWCERFPEAETHYFENGGHYIIEDEWESIKPIFLRYFLTDPEEG